MNILSCNLCFSYTPINNTVAAFIKEIHLLPWTAYSTWSSMSKEPKDFCVSWTQKHIYYWKTLMILVSFFLPDPLLFPFFFCSFSIFRELLRYLSARTHQLPVYGFKWLFYSYLKCAFRKNTTKRMFGRKYRATTILPWACKSVMGLLHFASWWLGNSLTTSY